MQVTCHFFQITFRAIGVSVPTLHQMVKAGERQLFLEQKELECQNLFMSITNSVLQD